MSSLLDTEGTIGSQARVQGEEAVTTWIYTLASVTLVSLVSLVGAVTLAWNPRRLHRTVLSLVSFAVGGLLGDAFLHLLPEAFRRPGGSMAPSLGTLGGVLAFFVLEKAFRRHLHAGHPDLHVHPVVLVNLLSDGFHNFVDGLLIGASYCVSPVLGLSTTVAVVMHEIPQELGDFGILVHGGLGVRKALLFNLLSGVGAIGGAIVALVAGQGVADLAAYVLPFTAGGFIYIAAADLVPELQRRDTGLRESAGQLGWMALGMSVMALLLLLE
jgi:zinc and cadmium transporter